jgi:hypothetical protein
MVQYMVRGSQTFVGSELDMRVYNRLPVGNYMVCFNPQSLQYYLQFLPTFEIPKKLYGNTTKLARRFLDTFADRENTTGVLLAGSKGSGKSLLMRVTSALGVERGISTLVISTPFFGDEFNSFIQKIEQECIIIFDEFEKVYDMQQQEQLLTLLDGSFPTRKLVIMTCNDKFRVNDHMMNRPGRLFYYIKYKGLPKDFIIEYCEDNLKDKTKIQSICSLSGLFDEFNFDMLKAVVEELNRYGESVKEAVDLLNVNYDQGHNIRYDVQILKDEKELKPGSFYPTVVVSPLSQEFIHFDISEDDPKDDMGMGDDRTIMVQLHGERTKVTPDLSKITLYHADLTIILTKVVAKSFDFSNVF